MANFSVIGFINTVKYLQDACIVYVDEYKAGYKKPNGEKVEEKYLTWKVIYKGYFKKFINTHFSDGMLVQVKGDIRPYAIEKEKMIDGYSVIGETINVYSYPRSSAKQEARMVKDSQCHSTGIPDLDAHNLPDF